MSPPFSVVREWAKSLGIELHGRFGSFDYLNVDGCIAKSQALATTLNGRKTALPTVTSGGVNVDDDNARLQRRCGRDDHS
jgi:hypothetical protein